jgi:uncharacterized protein (DUF1697 family)
MISYAAFLRGVSPMNAKMPELKRCFESANFTDVKTILSSGNVVFRAHGAPEERLERRAQAAMQKQLGRTFRTIVRSIDQLKQILDSDPFGDFLLAPGSKCVVSFLTAVPPKLALPIEQEGARIVCVRGTEAFTAYVRSPRGPVFMQLIDKTFGDEVTTRTWDTLKKVVRAGEG